MMKIKYKIFEKDKLLIQKFSGEFIFDKYILHARKLPMHPLISCVEKVLIDFRDMEFPAEMKDVDQEINNMTSFRKQANIKEPRIKNIIHVFWVDKPLPTVIAHLFVERFPDLIYTYCTTTEKVLKALEIKESISFLEDLIDKLEDSV